jgi:hypothetical protein
MIMANFSNPFMQGPDWGAGLSDVSSQIMQMLMMKKMFPDGKKSMGETAVPQQGMMGQSQQPPMPSGQMSPQGNMGFGGEGDNVMLQKILAALRGAGGGF